MRRNIYQMLWMMIVIVVIATACSNSSSEETVVGNEGPLQTFAIQCGDSYFRRFIDQTTHIVSLSGIRYSTDITGVDYQLVEGATIHPDPKEVIVWKQTQEFTVSTANGEKTVYTINLPELKEVQPKPEGTIVLGYLPLNMIQSENQFSHVRWQYLTHLAICFVKVKSDGTLYTEEAVNQYIEKVRDIAKQNEVKVLISFIQYQKTEFATAISNPTTRTKVVKGILDFVEQYKLDGFDIDYEDYSNWDQNYPALMTFIEELYEAKEATNPDWLMTSAVANPKWLNYGREWASYFDFLNLMIYDRNTPSGTTTPGNHSTVDDFISTMKYWNETLRVPKEKLVGGLPFYGYTWDKELPGADNVGAISYKNILSAYKNVSGIETLNHYGRTYWNGPNMIREKCQYTKDNMFGGVMIWQIFQDLLDDSPNNLIDVIGDVFEMDNNQPEN